MGVWDLFVCVCVPVYVAQDVGCDNTGQSGNKYGLMMLQTRCVSLSCLDAMQMLPHHHIFLH